MQLQRSQRRSTRLNFCAYKLIFGDFDGRMGNKTQIVTSKTTHLPAGHSHPPRWRFFFFAMYQNKSVHWLRRWVIYTAVDNVYVVFSCRLTAILIIIIYTLTACGTCAYHTVRRNSARHYVHVCAQIAQTVPYASLSLSLSLDPVASHQSSQQQPAPCLPSLTYFFRFFPQALVFKEMVSVRYSAAKERDMPLFRTLQWSWFVVAIFYTYGDFLHEFVLQHRALLWLSHITMFNAWLSFIAYCCVFVVSVLTLKKGLYKYQACWSWGAGEGTGRE